MAIELKKFEQKFFTIREGEVEHKIPVRSIGTRVALQLGDAYDELLKLQEKASELDPASIENSRLVRAMIEKFINILEICIVDFDQHRDIIDRIPMDIEVYGQVFEEIIQAMSGKDAPDDSKKKNTGASLRPVPISSSSKRGSAGRRFGSSTGSRG